MALESLTARDERTKVRLMRETNLPLRPVVVGTAVAAELLNTSEDQVREFVHSGLLATVPHLSSPKKLAIAVAELERFAGQGVMRTMRVAS